MHVRYKYINDQLIVLCLQSTMLLAIANFYNAIRYHYSISSFSLYSDFRSNGQSQNIYHEYVNKTEQTETKRMKLIQFHPKKSIYPKDNNHVHFDTF